MIEKGKAMNEYTFSEIEIGMKAGFKKQITKEMEDSFRTLSGDENPLHKVDAFAMEVGEGKFQRHVVFGMLTASLYSTIAGMYLPGKYSLIHSLDSIAFTKPVYLGDELSVTAEVTDKEESLKLIKLKVEIRKQDNSLVSKAKMKIILLR